MTKLYIPYHAERLAGFESELAEAVAYGDESLAECIREDIDAECRRAPWEARSQGEADRAFFALEAAHHRDFNNIGFMEGESLVVEAREILEPVIVDGKDGLRPGVYFMAYKPVEREGDMLTYSGDGVLYTIDPDGKAAKWLDTWRPGPGKTTLSKRGAEAIRAALVPCTYPRSRWTNDGDFVYADERFFALMAISEARRNGDEGTAEVLERNFFTGEKPFEPRPPKRTITLEGPQVWTCVPADEAPHNTTTGPSSSFGDTGDHPADGAYRELFKPLAESIGHGERRYRPLKALHHLKGLGLDIPKGDLVFYDVEEFAALGYESRVYFDNGKPGKARDLGRAGYRFAFSTLLAVEGKGFEPLRLYNLRDFEAYGRNLADVGTVLDHSSITIPVGAVVDHMTDWHRLSKSGDGIKVSSQREDRKKKRSVKITTFNDESLAFEALDELDRLVARLYCAFWHEGVRSFSLREITRLAYGIESPTRELIGKVANSLVKQSSHVVGIDHTEETRMPGVRRNLTIGHLVDLKIEYTEYQNGEETAVVRLLEEPPVLYEYCRAHKHLAAIPVDLLTSRPLKVDARGKTSTNAKGKPKTLRVSDYDIALRDYLISRVNSMRRNKKASRSITYDAIYRACGVDPETTHAQTLQRIRERAFGHLRSFERTRFIKFVMKYDKSRGKNGHADPTRSGFEIKLL